ncbi:MAG UNVERIFIED_CONTAM: hypothetical protein LVR18_51050 [Planctomycetaceae bacterium]
MAQGHFMCDEGRFGWKYTHAEERLECSQDRQQRAFDLTVLGRRPRLSPLVFAEGSGRKAEDRCSSVAVDDR